MESVSSATSYNTLCEGQWQTNKNVENSVNPAIVMDILHSSFSISKLYYIKSIIHLLAGLYSVVLVVLKLRGKNKHILIIIVPGCLDSILASQVTDAVSIT